MMLIALPTPWRIVPCSPSVSTAPAPRNSSDRKFRPLSGRSVICFSVMTWPTVAVSVSRAVVAAFTSTISVTAPGANPDRRGRPDRRTGGCPSAWRRGSLERGGHRVGADGQERERVVAALIRDGLARQARQVAVTVTVAPGTTAPVESLTVPVIWPVAVCALAVPAIASRASTAPSSSARFLYHHPPNARLQTPHLGVSARRDRPERQDSWRCEAHFRAWGCERVKRL